MQLLEYEAKSLLSHAGLPVPSGQVIQPGDAYHPSTFPLVVKSQVPVGGRGKLGGVRLVQNQDELETVIATLLQLDIKGYIPKSVLVESALDIDRELYVSLRLNRDMRRIEYLVSGDGGVEVESRTGSIALFSLEDTSRYASIATLLQLEHDRAYSFLKSLEDTFVTNDCLLLEINPLVVTGSGDLVCADAKVMIDDNARFRHPELPWQEVSPLTPLGGTIGVIANGAGMAMSTMDTLYAAGGVPANFLDIGGGTGEEVFVNNLRAITALPGVTSIIINIFAGITRCDDIARGIIAATKQLSGLPPLHIRLEGTNRDEAVRLLRDANISIEPDLKTCVEKAVGTV